MVFYNRISWSVVLAILVGGAWQTARAEETPNAARWPDEQVSGPFHVHANFSLDGFETLFQDLALLPDEVIDVLGITPPEEPIFIYLFNNKRVYQEYIRQYFPNVPARQALYVKERGPGMVFAYLNDELEIDLRHECTHALLHASLPMVPLWLDEGLAEYFETRRDDRRESSSHMNSVRWRCRLGFAPNIEKLEDLDNLASMTSGNYRDAWALVHFMLHNSPESHEELQRYLGEIASHSPPGNLSRRLSAIIPDLKGQISGHFR